MILRRALAALVLLSSAALGLAAPAGAGGSTWDVEPQIAVPGQQVTAGTCVAWAHDANLGAPDDGPYSMWISPVASNETSGGVALIPDGAVLLGEITIDEGGLWKNCGPNAASITFTVPDLAPGDYELVHCNEPCTDVLGDITWGVMTVAAADGSVPAPAPETTTSAPTTTSAAPTTTAPTSDDTADSDGSLEEAAAAILTAPDDEGGSSNTAALAVGLVLMVGIAAATAASRQKPTARTEG